MSAASKKFALFIATACFVLAAVGPLPGSRSFAAEATAGRAMGGEASGFRFPKMNPAHAHMRLLLQNAFRFLAPPNRMIDPESGYPVEGWNEDPSIGLHLRSFTQLTAIGEWVELLANIVAGCAENPYISKAAAAEWLSLAMGSLSADQKNPSLAAKGLLVNFLGLEGEVRTGPLAETVERDRLVGALGEKTGSAVWEALKKRGWVLPDGDEGKGRIVRGASYGSEHFDGALAPFADDPLKSRIMSLLDRRTALVVFGDNANLTASIAKSIGALLKPDIKDIHQVVVLRDKMERFIEAQCPGYAHLFDETTGTFFFGWDATDDRMMGWDNGQGRWTPGRMNYFINEFRGAWIFTVLRCGLPEASIRNAGFKIMPYQCVDGSVIHALASWEGSAFQFFGLSLFMQENLNPAWAKSLKNLVEIERDYSLRRGLPGFLSEAYSGNGAEYTGRIGIPALAVTDKPLITHTPSLYALGAAYETAPDEIEAFLEDHWPTISSLLTEHGPWEGYDASRNEIIRFQTTAHTLSLILGGIGTAHENMDRYLTMKGLRGALEKLYAPGKGVNLLSPDTEIIPWTVKRQPIDFKRENGGFRFTARLAGVGGATFLFPEDRGASLSNGRLRIRYRSGTQVGHAHISFRRAKDDPVPSPVIPIEIFTSFEKTKGEVEEVEIVLPATPALNDIQEISLVYGEHGKQTPVDLFIAGFDFVPFGSALASG